MDIIEGQKILVTGASGFIGAHLCRKLLECGAQVHGLSRKPRINDGIQWWSCDVSNPDEVEQVMEEVKPDIVYHLASYVTGTRDLEAIRPTFFANLASTVHLMSAALKIGVERFVTVGSLEEPVPERGEFVPASPYGAAKFASTAYARMFHELYNLPVVHLRLFMVYGPAQQDIMKLIPYVTLQSLKSEAPKISSGTREVDWIYVDDVVDAMVAAAVSPDLEGKTIDVGSGNLESIRGVVERIVHIANPDIAPEFGARDDRVNDIVRRADVEHASEHLGWKPKIDLDEGLRRTVAWYKNAETSGELAFVSMPWWGTS
ncbi:MAG: NAD-dependent dehydratase [Candidatus Hydrogenedentota bacterium]|nr:MAG: NAD-dependent dehydratase [Candidatus Hydrogenedentota bacterium]